MIGHFLKSAFARFIRSPFTTAANVLTLALGLASFLGAYGASVYWRSGDAYQKNAAHTYFIGTRIDIKEGGPALGAGMDQHGLYSSSTLARYLPQDIPEIEDVARASLPAETAVSTGDTKLMLHAVFADTSFLDIFALDFVAGSSQQALARPDGIILTLETAQRLFGSCAALGQEILIDNTWTGVVTGVIAPVRQPSFMGTGQDAVMRFDMLGAWSGHPAGVVADRRDTWLQLDAFTFVVLPPSLPSGVFNQRLAALLEARIPAEYTARATMRAAAMPLADMTTRNYDALIASQLGAALPMPTIVLILGAIALGVAVVNYANLATAQAAMRAREIGMQRVVGAGGIQIMLQTWNEALIQAIAAFATAIGVLTLAAPVVRRLSGVDILYFLASGAGSWLGVAVLVLGVAFLSGAYPALVLSRIRPASALRTGRSGTASRSVARVFVMIQFASASFLLLLVIAAQQQRAHIEDAALAPREHPILVLNSLANSGVDFETLRTELSSQPGVKDVSVASDAPWDTSTTGRPVGDVRQVGRTAEQASSANFSYAKMVGLDYFEALNIDLLAGRLLEERDAVSIDVAIPADSNIVIDALLARNLGFETPRAAVGETVYIFRSTAQIVGVVDADMMRINGVAGDAAGTLYTYYPVFPPYVSPQPIVRGGNLSGRSTCRILRSI